jgi:hypothetical protein
MCMLPLPIRGRAEKSGPIVALDGVVFEVSVAAVTFLDLPVIQSVKSLKAFLRGAPASFIVKYRNHDSLANGRSPTLPSPSVFQSRARFIARSGNGPARGGRLSARIARGQWLGFALQRTTRAGRRRRMRTVEGLRGPHRYCCILSHCSVRGSDLALPDAYIENAARLPRVPLRRAAAGTWIAAAAASECLHAQKRRKSEFLPNPPTVVASAARIRCV